MNAGSINPKKVAVVSEYLKGAFPGHHVYDEEDFERDCQFFRIDEGGAGSVKHRLRVSREFLDDHNDEAILRRLREWRLRDVLREAGARSVLVTNSGCVIETGR